MTQVTDVKPLLTVATYLDRNQATEAYQEVSGKPCIPCVSQSTLILVIRNFWLCAERGSETASAGVCSLLSQQMMCCRKDFLPSGRSPRRAWTGEAAKGRSEDADTGIQICALPGDEATGARH